jgi:hypothetical protein
MQLFRTELRLGCKLSILLKSEGIVRNWCGKLNDCVTEDLIFILEAIKVYISL